MVTFVVIGCHSDSHFYGQCDGQCEGHCYSLFDVTVMGTMMDTLIVVGWSL